MDMMMNMAYFDKSIKLKINLEQNKIRIQKLLKKVQKM